MARIAGVNVPDHKHAGVSLTYIFGIGRTTAAKIVTRRVWTLRTRCRTFLRRTWTPFAVRFPGSA